MSLFYLLLSLLLPATPACHAEALAQEEALVKAADPPKDGFAVANLCR